MGRQTSRPLIVLFERREDVDCVAKWISGGIVELFYQGDNNAEGKIRSGARQTPRLVRERIVKGRSVL